MKVIKSYGESSIFAHDLSKVRTVVNNLCALGHMIAANRKRLATLANLRRKAPELPAQKWMIMSLAAMTAQSLLGGIVPTAPLPLNALALMER